MQYAMIVFISLLISFDNGWATHQEDPPKKTICLNMIIKDETPVIRRCLATVKPMIDYWVIVDTGSTDGTQEMVKEFMKDIPGELHERPWKNFGHNRNEALQLAKGKGDYLLFIDADEVFKYSNDFKRPSLNADFYYITTEYNGLKYGRVQLINNHLNWQWLGVLHEYLDSPEAKTHGIALGITNVVNTDGNRSQDPQKYQKDAKLLEKAIQDEPNNSRYRFYLAQSYRDSEQYEKAIESYQKRIEMGGFDQEIFYSKLQIAIMNEILKMDPEIVIDSYNTAFESRPSRIEPLYRLAAYYRGMNNFQEAYNTTLKGLRIRNSNDVLFVDQWIYDYGFLLEYSVAAYWLEKYTEALLASYLLISNPALPQDIRQTVQKNLVWINQKMNEQKQQITDEAITAEK